MNRYFSDKIKKEKKKQCIANSYSCERSHRVAKNTYAKSRYKMSFAHNL